MTDCWHVDEYGAHCWQAVPNSHGHAGGPTYKCDVCGAIEEDPKTVGGWP